METERALFKSQNALWGVEGNVVVPSEPTLQPPATAPARKSHRSLYVVIAAVAIVIVAVVAAVGLALAYHTFSFTISETSGSVDSGVYNESFPVGVQVSGSWTSANGVAIQFQIETSGGAIVQSYLGYTGPGSFSLTTSYSHYLFAVDSTQLTSVSVSGYYWAFW